MGKVCAGATMSLDGYIAGPEDTGFELLFKWYGAGDVTVPMPHKYRGRAGTPPSRPRRRRSCGGRLRSWGALVVGRHLYDLTNAWGGRHPLDVPTVVLTHNPADRSTAGRRKLRLRDRRHRGSDDAKAQEIAGDKNVAVNSGQMARQALEAGLLDEVGMDLVPVILGAGKRFFEGLEHMPMELGAAVPRRRRASA